MSGVESEMGAALRRRIMLMRSAEESMALLGSLRREWDGEGYSVLSRNCNDFSASVGFGRSSSGIVGSWVGDGLLGGFFPTPVVSVTPSETCS